MRQFVASPNEHDMRLSRFVEKATSGMPASLLYKSFRLGRIKLNGKKAKPQSRLAQGDVIQLYLNDEFFAAPGNAKKGTDTTPQLTTVWQDNNLAVLYKPAGLLSHSNGAGTHNLLDAFVTRLRHTGEYDPQKENTFTPALTGRLDRNTEGLVIGAKTYAALRDMGEIIRLGLLRKSYLCITVGTPPEGTFEAYLQRDLSTKTVTVTGTPLPNSKAISTGVRIVERKNGLCLCEIELLTGRTHQIRAHLAHLGAPLLGDGKYGRTPTKVQAPWQGQALCAWQLKLCALPPENSLAYMQDKSFTASGYAKLPGFWALL